MSECPRSQGRWQVVSFFSCALLPSLDEIGHRFGIPRERIRQLQNGALAKLGKILDQLEDSPQ